MMNEDHMYYHAPVRTISDEEGNHFPQDDHYHRFREDEHDDDDFMTDVDPEPTTTTTIISSVVPREQLLSRFSVALSSTVSSPLSALDLSSAGLRSSDGVVVRAIVRRHASSLRRLSLSDNPALGDEGAVALSSGIENSVSLTRFDARRCGVHDVGAARLVTALSSSSSSSLRALDLDGNLFGDAGGRTVANALANDLIGVERLGLSDHHMGAEGVRAVCQALAEVDRCDRPLSFRLGGGVDVSGHVAAACASLVVEARGDSLRELALTKAGLEDADVMLLSRALAAHRRSGLLALDLSRNRVRDTGGEALMNALWGRPALEHLDLSFNRLGDHGAQLVAVGTTSLPSFRSLDVSHNAHGAPGNDTLFRTLVASRSRSRRSTVSSLSMQGSPINVRVAAEALLDTDSTTLRELRLTDAGWSPEGRRGLVEAIVRSSSLRLTHFDGFPLGPEIAALLRCDGDDGDHERFDMTTWDNDRVLRLLSFVWDRRERAEDRDQDVEMLDEKSFYDHRLHQGGDETMFCRRPMDVATIAEAIEDALRCARESDAWERIRDDSAQTKDRHEDGWYRSPREIDEDENDENNPTPNSFSHHRVPDLPALAANETARLERNLEWLRHHAARLGKLRERPPATDEPSRLRGYFYGPCVNENPFAVVAIEESNGPTDDDPFARNHKRVRRSAPTRASYYPRVKARLDDLFQRGRHDSNDAWEALVLMRRLFFVERSLSSNENDSVVDDKTSWSSAPVVTASLASDAESILLDLM